MGLIHIGLLVGILVFSGHCLQLREVVKKSMDAFINGTREDNEQVLKQYFFTKDRESSVWPLVYESTEKISGYQISYSEWRQVEQDVGRFANHIYSCEHGGITSAAGKATCYLRALELVEQTVGDIKWNFLKDIVHEQIATKMSYHFLVRSMICNLFRVLEKFLLDIPKRDEQSRLKSKMNFFYHRTKQNLDLVVDYSPLRWREDQVSAPEICQVRQYFWQDSEEKCETRWKRSLDDGDDGGDATSARDVVEKSPRRKTEAESAPATGSKRSGLNDNNAIRKAFRKALDDEAIENKVNGIGGISGDYELRMVCKVTDHVNGKVIHKEFMRANVGEKGRTMEKLLKNAWGPRNAYVADLKGNIGPFINGWLETFALGIKTKLKEVP